MVQIETITPEIAWRLEQVECAAFADCYRAATPAVAEACGVAVHPAGDGVAAVVGCADVLALNRIMGPGILTPANEASVDAALSKYADAGVPRVFVQIDPVTTDAKLPELLLSRGGRHYNNWVKLYRGMEPLPPVDTDLRVAEIGTEHAAAFGEIVADAFGWPEGFRSVVAATVGRSGWRHYMAFDGERPVATAAMYVAEGAAWIDFAATLEGYRGRGAQGKLVEVRIADAAALDAELLVVETAQQTPEKSAPSYRNMIRYGFKEAYVRPNYLFELK